MQKYLDAYKNMQKYAKLDLHYVRFEYILYMFYILKYIKNLLNLVMRNRWINFYVQSNADSYNIIFVIDENYTITSHRIFI